MFRRIEEAGIPYILIDRGFVGLAATISWASTMKKLGPRYATPC